MPNALELTGIRKSFDGFAALTDAHFAARWGEVHALLGENGAGKSSLMNIAAGLYAPETGAVLVDDNAVRFGGPRDAARHRIGMVHQHFKLVKPFTVAQNILLTAPPAAEGLRHGQRLAQVERDIRAKARELGFDIDPTRRVETLSVAEQQRVEILKVLLAGARILILDEPTAVLTDTEAERLLQTVHGLARGGAAVVLVTHKMADVKTYADRVTVMRGGRTVATVDPKETSTQQLVKLTVGDSTPAEAAPRGTPGDVKLRITGLRTPESGGRRVLDGVDLTVRAGEIYGIAGVGGNGQGELAAAIMGLPMAADGEIVLEGHGDLRRTSTADRRELGLAAIPADRYGLALAGSLSVAENFGVGQVHTGRYGPAWHLRAKDLEADAAEAVREFDVQGVRSTAQKAALLSGGNAQKLVIAREFSKSPRVVLAHSPSRGLDVRAGAAVHARLRAARDAGAAVLLISEDLDEVLALADRVGVMTRGRIVAEHDQPADRQAIGQAMVDHG
ncbi:ABC transporter ATP-binding protein [Piscinibacter gummiphilus]|uniref:ABC transporter ATP-binding protein n=1 Tax=Piscinibacter gummiphilus TaxID=946333 RepID=A0A1W6L2N2_9BURK|nr:ABC transporter ATP-binding protein [Piscinibacter gummiphilus]ARN18483.1 ABC transporter ATP-binding protein [Piscinibacter gummiphilus]ATU63109.1 ABC transporter ATP-binding protein [Piscinibacter gummiphilus]GLS95424.1 ABC transporter ATP-binding protein [Piscinibacter gummiphilus]